MEFDLYWLLLAAPVVFLLGWMASRLDLRQLKREDQASPQAYFKGLNLLLNEQQDKAIDAFIEAVQHDPDTTDLHFALGNLFRRRGEYERAIRIHQHLLSRGDLKREERKQDEVNERAQRDRERSQMEGRIAAQMERSNALMEAMKALMESVVTSNEVLHADLANSQARSQGMAAKVDHIADRVDLLYKESAR